MTFSITAISIASLSKTTLSIATISTMILRHIDTVHKQHSP